MCGDQTIFEVSFHLILNQESVFFEQLVWLFFHFKVNQRFSAMNTTGSEQQSLSRIHMALINYSLSRPPRGLPMCDAWGGGAVRFSFVNNSQNPKSSLITIYNIWNVCFGEHWRYENTGEMRRHWKLSLLFLRVPWKPAQHSSGFMMMSLGRLRINYIAQRVVVSCLLWFACIWKVCCAKDCRQPRPLLQNPGTWPLASMPAQWREQI